MIKLTVLNGQPANPAVFEDYYANTHLPLVAKIKGFEKVEYTKFMSAPDGGQAAYFRMAEFWYSSAEVLQTSMGTEAGKAAGNDISNFATGGATFIVGEVAG